MAMTKNPGLDSEELEILTSFERGEWVTKGENLDKYKEAARQTFKKDHRINFRVSQKDFRSIQIRARKEGIAYQTLVSSILHKYLTGQLRES